MGLTVPAPTGPRRAGGAPGTARPTLERSLAVMDPAARALALTAGDLLARVHVRGIHDVAAAGLLADGRTVTGVHVEASQGRASVCAEGGLVSAAAAAGSPLVGLVALVRRADGGDHLIEPCGVCAELLVDHHRDAWLWAGRDGAPVRLAVTDLLPYRVARTGRPGTDTEED